MATLDEIRQKIRDNLYTTKGKFVDGNVSKRFKSPIWGICDEIYDESNQKITNAIFCVKCKMVFKYDTRSNGTSQILNHGCLKNDNQTKITGFASTKNVTISSSDKKNVKDAAVKFCTKDLRPFESLNGDGFFDVVRTCIQIGAKYGILEDEDIKSLLPSPATASRCVNEYGSEVKRALYRKVCNLAENGMSFTTDLWTDNYRRISYLVITAHMVDRKINSAEYCLRDQILCLIPLSVYEKKTGEYLSGVIDDILERIGLLPHISKIIFVTDRGANIRNAFRMLNIKRLNCYDHLLNNVVGKVCQLELVDYILAPVRKLVKFIKIGGHNSKFARGLKSYCPTRWNTNHDMSVSVEENFEQLEIVLTDLNQLNRLDVINRMYLKEVIAFLKLFKIISIELEKSNSPSLYLVWPSNVRIMKFVSQSLQTDSTLMKKMKKTARAYLKNNFVLDKLHRIATILHPQLKSVKFAEEDEKIETIRDLKAMMSTISTDAIDTSHTRRRKSNDSVVSDFFDDACDIDEVEMYVAQKIAPADINILKWWDDHKETYPKLNKIAMFIHSIPATSAPSERKFSLAGNVLNCLRSSLNPSKVEDLLLLHSNCEDFDGMNEHGNPSI